MAGGKGKSIGGKATGAKDSGAKPQKSHSAKAGLQVCLLLRQQGDKTLLARITTQRRVGVDESSLPRRVASSAEKSLRH